MKMKMDDLKTLAKATTLHVVARFLARLIEKLFSTILH